MSTKNHVLEPLSTKVEQLKEKYEEEIRTIQDISDGHSETMKEVEDSIRELEQSKFNALEISQRLRKQAILDIKEYFDSIDAKIISFIKDKMEKLEKKRIELQSRFQEIKSDCDNLNDMLHQNSSRLLVEGEAILKNVRSIQTTSFDFEREKVSIEIAKGASWKPVNAASLNFKNELGLRANIKSTASLPETVPGTLSSFANKQFRKLDEVDLRDDAANLRIVGNQLWSFRYFSIEIFDKSLKSIKVLSNDEWDNLYDVTEMPNVGIVIACTSGLFQIHDDGYIIKKIDSGGYNSVDTHKDRLYAYSYDDCMVRTYFYGGSWQQGKSINCSHNSNLATIRVNDHKIVVCSYERPEIEVLSLTGETLHTCNHYLTKIKDDSRYQRLCQVDSEGALLIVEECSNNLMLVDKCQHWSIVDIDPEFQEPSFALYVDDILYVLGKVDWKYKLCKYTST